MSGVGRLVVLVVALVLTLLIAACDQTGPTPGPVNPPQPTAASNGEVVVFAASSLTDVFGQIAKDVQVPSNDIAKLTYNFAGSQALVTQLSQGAKADILVTADEKSMQSAADAGVVLTNTYRTFASSKLTVITAPGDQTKISTLQDLAKPGLKLVLAAPAVPAGNYALQVLNKFSADSTYGSAFKDAVLANVVSREDNVRQVVAKVQLGEADAGIVYVTDARGGQAGTIDIPDQYNVVAEYFISVLPSTANEAGARAFVGYLLSDEGQKTLADYGFSPPLPK